MDKGIHYKMREDLDLIRLTGDFRALPPAGLENGIRQTKLGRDEHPARAALAWIAGRLHRSGSARKETRIRFDDALLRIRSYGRKSACGQHGSAADLAPFPAVRTPCDRIG